MIAISIRQPWVWAILHLGKRIENREQRWRYRGEVMLHASSFGRFTDAQLRTQLERGEFAPTKPQNEVLDELESAFDMAKDSGVVNPPKVTPRVLFGDHSGAIVGRARIVDCVENSDSWWFVGPFGLVLEDVRPIATPVPCKGALGLWAVPADVALRIEAERKSQ